MLDPDKRESILNAALRAFEQLGFRKTSIGEIAKGAGVGKGTIYLAAKNKEDLFYQVILRDIRNFIASQAQRLDPQRPADELLAELAHTALDHIESRPLLRWLLTGVLAVELPTWAEKFEDLRAMARSNISEIIKLGIRQGRFRADLDPDATAEILHDLQFAGYVLYVRTAHCQNIDIRERSERTFELLFQGLLAREEPSVSTEDAS